MTSGICFNSRSCSDGFFSSSLWSRYSSSDILFSIPSHLPNQHNSAISPTPFQSTDSNISIRCKKDQKR
ncbi:hypothetical protein RchiOBHm_Chr7g0236381 [Rosa chinensis]|uniref:Uncharacterized protein n=1 Tax=Rosa chinensis TaxID=74649 RepID=A0A2P6PGY0_ROSCH|nr:hypothetical protein RchiOBHm_Chr7g0236381 [Rosa chinensis]